MEVEIRVMRLQTEAHLRPPEAGRGRQEGLSWGGWWSGGNAALPHLDLGHLACRMCKNRFLWFPSPLPARRAVLAVQMCSADKSTTPRAILGGMYSGHLVSAYADTDTGGTTFPTPLFICKHTAAERSRDSRVLS